MPEPVKIPVSMPLSTPEPMKEEMPATSRKRFIAKGVVQKVGYRDEVQIIARSLGISGYVRNLKTGDVEIICEGEEANIWKFEKALTMKKDLIDVQAVVPAGEPSEKDGFEFFEIKYGPMEEELGERMGAGIQYIKEVGQKVDSMHHDMNIRFDHMANHYDMIALTLKEAIVHMDRNAEKTDKAIEKSRKETILAVRKSQKDTAELLARSRKETLLELRKSHKETTKELSRSRQEIAASNRELAKAVNFMIKKLSDKPPRRKTPKKR